MSRPLTKRAFTVALFSCISSAGDSNCVKLCPNVLQAHLCVRSHTVQINDHDVLRNGCVEHVMFCSMYEV